jgi:hypothetical protein
MGKSSGRMGSSKSSSNNGILGSGIFGFFGTAIKCDSKDDSMYCNFMKFFNVLIVIGIMLFILSFLYSYLKKGRR